MNNNQVPFTHGKYAGVRPIDLSREDFQEAMRHSHAEIRREIRREERNHRAPRGPR